MPDLNAHTAPQPVQLTPHQAITTLIIEAHINALRFGAVQLGDFVGLKDEAKLLVSAADHLTKGLEKMRRHWQSGLVIVGANEAPAEPKGA